MSTTKVIAIALLAGGVLGLAVGGFSYTSQTHHTQIGPIELSVAERKTVNVPLWVGLGAIVAGAALLLIGSKRG